MDGAGGLYQGDLWRGKVAGSGGVEEEVVVACGDYRVDGAGAGVQEGCWEHWVEGFVLMSATSTVSWKGIWLGG